MTSLETTPARRAAFTGLAAVGFLALVISGIWLAVYSARYVPSAVTGLGSAAVYIGSIFSHDPSPDFAVIPTASTTIAFPDASSTPATTTPTTPTPVKPQPVNPTPGQETSGTYPMGGSGAVTTHSGLADLTVSIDAVGYLTGATADSFVAAGTVPHGSRPAVRFTVRNVGGTVASPWIFFANIPTQNSYLYQSAAQQALNPGDSIQYTLGFDQANSGNNQTVSISVNPNHAVTESDLTNDSASATLTILGS